MPGNFAIRLRCPLCEADSWVTLADRQETYEQIQQQTWEFKCREHGPQTGTPKEVMGVAPLDDPPPCTQQSALAFANPLSTEKTKRIPRSSERLPLRIPVVVYGFTKNCGAFHEETETQTVNASGALVVLKTKLALGDSVFLVQRGNGLEQEVRVVYLDSYTDRETKWRKKKYRVVWIGHVGSIEANQVGVVGLQNEKDIWRVELPEGEPDDEPDKDNPPKK